jgi:hypothetical protein
VSTPYTEAIPKIEAALKAAGATSVEVTRRDSRMDVEIKAICPNEDIDDAFNDVIEAACKDLGWDYFDLDGDILEPYAILRWDEGRVPASVHAETLAELTEARAEIAALRGLAEGAVGSGWSYNRMAWEWRDPASGMVRAYVQMSGVWEARVLLDGPPTHDWASGEAPTLRTAMRAALDALGVSHE